MFNIRGSLSGISVVGREVDHAISILVMHRHRVSSFFVQSPSNLRVLPIVLAAVIKLSPCSTIKVLVSHLGKLCGCRKPGKLFRRVYAKPSSIAFGCYGVCCLPMLLTVKVKNSIPKNKRALESDG